MGEPLQRDRARLGEVLVLAAIYVTAGALGHLLATLTPGNVTPFWPPAGIALAALLIRGTRLWPGILLGAFVETTRMFFDATNPQQAAVTLTVGASISVGCLLEALLAARLLRCASLPPRDTLNHVRGVVCFALVGMFASALGATVGTTSLFASSLVAAKGYSETWLTWWIGDTVGILVWTPVVLAFSKKSRNVRWLEIGVQQLTLIAFQVLFIGGALPLATERYPLGHLVTPFLVWAGVRLGPQGATLAILNVTGLATWATMNGLGPFVHDSLNTSLLLVQTFIGNVTLTTLVLGAVIHERTCAEAALAESRSELERHVQERTAELAETNRLLAAEIDQRREKERKLRDSEERYRILVEVNPDAVFVLSVDEKQEDRRILFANPAATVLVGAEPEALLGMHTAELVPEQRREAFHARILQIIEHGRIDRFEDKIFRLDGTVVFVEVTSALVPWDSGRALLVVLRDITRRKQVEEQRAQLYREAEESIRARDEFLSIASHELKTPLTSLTLQLQGLVRKAQKDSALSNKIAPTLEVAIRQTGRLGALIDDLLDVSRITQGRLVLTFEDVDLTATVRDVVERMQQMAMRAGCEIRLHACGAVAGRWDRARLEQVAENLLSNAIKYGAGGPIDVEVRATMDEKALFSVRDRGIGISPEDQSRIFGQFERAVSVSQFGGFGLGLWIARRIVEAHGGVIAVESAPGEGSTFVVTLPRAPERGKWVA